MSNASIWNTIEMYCVCRDFDYAQYLSTHTMSGCKGAPLTELAYAKVSELLHQSILDDADKRAEIAKGWKLVKGEGCSCCFDYMIFNKTADLMTHVPCGSTWERVKV